ncbi:helix-turn-helix domain-containing protein [Aureivirga marina]|uniref:helix-turn-helix domain-containing protein n=1 Tax=Aureivirga marina TaxID=1182451 RepID=UPI0018CB9F89|nr:helix-turn-helix transcriptional regulator [Aureivirga marina]
MLDKLYQMLKEDENSLVKEPLESYKSEILNKPEIEFDSNNILKTLREKKGIKITEVAEAIGVSVKTVYNYEEDITKLKYNEINKLAKLFEVTPLDFYADFSNKKKIDLDELKNEVRSNKDAFLSLSNKLDRTNEIMDQFKDIITLFHEKNNAKTEEFEEHLEAISTIISLATLDISKIKDN